MTVAGQLAEYLACVEMTMVADHRDLRPFLPVAKDLDIVQGLRGSAVGLDIINTSAALACVEATRNWWQVCHQFSLRPSPAWVRL